MNDNTNERREGGMHMSKDAIRRLVLGSAVALAGAPALAGPKGLTVDMKVTEKGFEPGSVKVKKGEPVTLVITRTTDKTCATEILIDETSVNTKLPLNKAVKVSFTPKKSGELKYGCAMGKMIGGVLTVE
jgi:plastocyanin domain-containing protein